jgi:hypothetical protein
LVSTASVISLLPPTHGSTGHLIQLQFSAGAEGWVEKLCHERLALIKIMSVKPQDHEDQITHFVDISSENATAEDLSKELGTSSEITESDLARVASNRVIGSVTSTTVLCAEP